jgi:hypothetical protein
MYMQVEAPFPSLTNESMWSGLRAAALSPSLAQSYTRPAREAAEGACESLTQYLKAVDSSVAQQQRDIFRISKNVADEISHEVYSCAL